MADSKLTGLAALTNADDGDFAYLVDVSDTTDDAAGSSRKITVANLLSSLGVPRKLFDHYADTGNTSTDGTTFDDAYSDTVAAGQLAANGDVIDARYCLTFASSATATRRVKVSFGGTVVLDSGANTFASGGTADIWLSVARESSTVVRVAAEFVPSGVTLQPIVTYTRITGLTLSNTQVLKLMLTAGGTGAAASDVLAKLGAVEYKPAA